MNTGFQNPPAAGLESTVPAAGVTGDMDMLRKELAGQRDLNLRLAADFENFKRRARLEAEVRASAQKDSFILELLPVLDNLERALASGASSSQLHQGVEMTLRQMRLLLRQHGIEAEESAGQPFDPRKHEAISQCHDPAHAEHSIVEVFQRGYRRGEKVLRPAKVVVNDLAHSNQGRHDL